VSYIVHVGYVLTLCALLARDVLWLRVLLAAAQTLVASYAWSIGVLTIAGWNAAFVMINVTWVVLIVRERRAVELPDDLRRLHARHFAALSPGEFLRWWRQGRRQHIRDARLASVGEQPQSLFFLLGGKARVARGPAHVADLAPGCFIAEMSLLTGEPANADVHAVGEVQVMSWPVADLRAVRDRNPALWSKIQSAIGHDLVEKIRRGETVPAAPPAGRDSPTAAPRTVDTDGSRLPPR
jgi:CRP-like cAMP-binding protein